MAKLFLLDSICPSLEADLIFLFHQALLLQVQLGMEFDPENGGKPNAAIGLSCGIAVLSSSTNLTSLLY